MDCLFQQKKLSILDQEVDEMANKTYVGNNDEDISGGNIRTGHLETIVILNWIKNISKINELGYWEINDAKDMRDWGINSYHLFQLEQDGYIDIRKGKSKSKFNVKLSLTGKPFPKIIDGVLD
tara:strand:- start:207 stop:575 length:369 start_codon:yes stop_codon:yes gene_type:complete